MITGLHPLKKDGELFRTGAVVFKFFTGQGAESAYEQTYFSRSCIDSLTRVYNRRYILERLEDEFSWFYRPEPRHLSILMLDVDFFKLINDTYGHLGGDKVLKSICERIEGRLRKHEKLGRMGGEEFLVIMPEADREKSLKLAEEIRTLVAGKSIEYDGKQINVTLSIGIATIEKTAEKIDESLLDYTLLLEQADKNLYRAKNNGRNQVCCGQNE